MSDENKTVAASHTVMTEMILPSDTNPMGNAFGGRVMQWIDCCAAMCAQRHCRTQVVTASIDALQFKSPIRLGEFARLEARVNAAFGHSLEVEVIVTSEDPTTGDRRPCCDAFLTFAALNGAGRPTTVPRLITENEEEEARAAAAEGRRAARLADRGK